MKKKKNNYTLGWKKEIHSFFLNLIFIQLFNIIFCFQNKT